MRISKILGAAKVMTIAVVLAVVGMVTFGNTAKADEQPEVALSMSPTMVDINLKASEETTGEVLVVNDGLVALNVVMEALPYTITSDYSQNVFDAPSTRTQITGWVSFAEGESQFRLEGGEQKLVRYTITVPSSVPSGGQYAAISSRGTVDGASGVAAVYQIASLILGEVDGTTVRGGEVVGRQFGGWYDSSHVATRLTVKNTGNTHFFATNRLIVEGFFGGEVARVELEPKLVFGEDGRDFEIEWTTDRPLGIYWLTQESEFLGEVHSERRLAMILPIWFMVLCMLTLVVLVVVIVKLAQKRRYQNKARKNEKTS